MFGGNSISRLKVEELKVAWTPIVVQKTKTFFVKFVD